MMIEADVNIGRINGTGDLIPIMAHPPTVTSDLSLEHFLNTVIQVRKSTEILSNNCLGVLSGVFLHRIKIKIFFLTTHAGKS